MQPVGSDVIGGSESRRVSPGTASNPAAASTTVTENPRSISVFAADIPAAPAPTTTKSGWSYKLFCVGDELKMSIPHERVFEAKK